MDPQITVAVLIIHPYHYVVVLHCVSPPKEVFLRKSYIRSLSCHSGDSLSGAKPFTKPKTVIAAIRMAYASLIIGLPRIFLMEQSQIGEEISFGYAFSLLIFTFALLLFIIHEASSGKNWARITLLIFCVLGIPLSVQPMIQSLATNLLSGLLGIAQSILQIIAVILLFQKSSNLWFVN